MSEPIGCQSYGIFWDIENCPIPPTERASNIIQSIKQFIATQYESKVGQKSEPCTVVCSCDTQKLDVRHVEALNRSGVDILHVNPIKNLNGGEGRGRVPLTGQMSYKVNADSKLIECIQKYIDHHFNKQKCLLFVITGDIDFAPAIRSAKRRGFEVILLYGAQSSTEIKICATESHSYHEITERSHSLIGETNTNSRPSVSLSNASANVGPQVGPQLSFGLVSNTTQNRSNPSNTLQTSSINTLDPFEDEVRKTASKRRIDTEKEGKAQNSVVEQKSVEVEYDPKKVQLIQEVARVDRHIALRVLQSTSGNVELAINLILND